MRTSVSRADDRAILACSAASRKRTRVTGSSTGMLPACFWNACSSQSATRRSISLPPRWESPAVASTCTMPPRMRKTDTSKVPPPKS